MVGMEELVFTRFMYMSAGVLGQVGSSGALNHVDCSVGFRLQVAAAGGRILSAGLRCVLLNKAAAKRQPRTRSAFMADLGKLATADDKVCTPCLPTHALLPASFRSVIVMLPSLQAHGHW